MPGPMRSFVPVSTSKGLLSIDEVLKKYKHLQTPEGMQKLVVKLAVEAVFGEEVLVRSTLTGKTHGIPLDEQKLESLQTVLRQAVYPELTAEVFKAGFWSQCKNAIV